MEYRKLNYIKNGVNRCRAIDRSAAAREQFPAYALALYFRQVHIDIFRSLLLSRLP